jgi:pimeloyl-ACP methyl ester carboxylesterase
MNKFLILFLLPVFALAQNTFKMEAKKAPATIGTTVDINEFIKGTLLMVSETDVPVPLVILFTGSGPNDRNGNSMMTRNDSHKQLALALQKENIATYRYDKRSFTLVSERKPTGSISFDDFVTDAKNVVGHFKNDPRFNKIILAGHSQGSLVAMLAMDESIDGFISIAGPADPIDQTIVQQVATQAPGLDKELEQVFEKMKSQDSLVSKINPYLLSIVGPEIQPFMKSWMKYDPKEIIKDLEIPVLIINGTRDRQVDVTQAKKLHAAIPDAQLMIIEGMDHIFKKVSDDDIEASKSYTDPSFPLHPELVASVVSFVKQ